ncbi:CASP-like protein 4a3 [Phtheirospermum japonicum]|uniref:CASP-like protein n=1 Tax=Phtheirospermum japonicum TaxID=374723 RepID=A0A830CIB3_9LAMI|nr:CASP-like protein 4a3 [Phtheirospermum japonicum]
MENQNKPPRPTAPDSVSPPPRRVAVPDSEEHISLSPPFGSSGNSPADSYSSPLHSKHNSGEHISLTLSPIGSPGNSPVRSSLASDHIDINHSPEQDKLHSPENKPPPAAVVRRDVFKEPMENRVVLEEPMSMAVVERAVLEEPKAVSGPAVVEGGGGGRRRYRPSLSILRGAKREKMVKKSALGFRVFGFLFCLVSFSVMSADRNQGWAVDSFDRYREFRYCMSVNVIGFIYSAAQSFDLSYNLVTGKYIVHHQQRLRYYFDFAVDQIIAYLLISASSSAAIRVEDWQSNWGKDKFPDMATASISMSFLAFIALAISSLISGYALCTSKSV